MSDVTATLAISAALLATYGLLIACTMYCFRLAFLRMDEIVTGVVNGLPVSVKHRWNMLFFSFNAYANGAAIIQAVFGLGYFQMVGVAGDSAVGTIALVCGAACVWGIVAIVFPAIYLNVYLVSVLRSTS